MSEVRRVVVGASGGGVVSLRECRKGPGSGDVMASRVDVQEDD